MEFEQFHEALRTLYDEMMPLCGNLTGVAKGIAGIGAMFYIAYRVWHSLANAEPIEVFPLLRPFAIGICIMFFPTLVIGTINSIMSPVVQGTHQMVADQTLNMKELGKQRDQLEAEIMKRNPEEAYLVDDEAYEAQMDQLGIFDAPEALNMYVQRGMYKMEKSIRNMFRSFLEILFKAAALVIDVIRTFFLIVLTILGPLAFAFSVYDGFQSSLVQWITRYLSVYLWLPVSDLFSCILAKLQSITLTSDIAKMQADPTFSVDSSDIIYVVFLIIGIIGYFTIPTVANWIVQAGGGGALSRGINMIGTKAAAFTGGLAGAAAGNVAGGALKAGGYVKNRISDYIKSKRGGNSKSE